MEKEKTYYDILGVPNTATQGDISTTYRKLALQYHPDKNRGKELEATGQFQPIVAAYEVLNDADEREKYDFCVRYGLSFNAEKDDLVVKCDQCSHVKHLYDLPCSCNENKIVLCQECASDTVVTCKACNVRFCIENDGGQSVLKEYIPQVNYMCGECHGLRQIYDFPCDCIDKRIPLCEKCEHAKLFTCKTCNGSCLMDNNGDESVLKKSVLKFVQDGFACNAPKCGKKCNFKYRTPCCNENIAICEACTWQEILCPGCAKRNIRAITEKIPGTRRHLYGNTYEYDVRPAFIDADKDRAAVAAAMIGFLGFFGAIVFLISDESKCLVCKELDKIKDFAKEFVSEKSNSIQVPIYFSETNWGVITKLTYNDAAVSDLKDRLYWHSNCGTDMRNALGDAIKSFIDGANAHDTNQEMMRERLETLENAVDECKNNIRLNRGKLYAGLTVFGTAALAYYSYKKIGEFS